MPTGPAFVLRVAAQRSANLFKFPGIRLSEGLPAAGGLRLSGPTPQHAARDVRENIALPVMAVRQEKRAMESSHPYPLGLGGRVLAAIVFTDVVSFSARIQAREVPTLSLLEQDFALMREHCERYSGSVLKSTGDGLLLHFSSAVHAVRCAVKIQRSFAERARANPADENLIHRIGVHLGDIFATDREVMGDGVNIAARLQAVADPGGICISQTVYDVVKNKLELEVERLAPRDLKNISEVGNLYRVLLEPRKKSPAPPAFRPPEQAPAAFFSRTENLVISGLVLLALAVVAGLMMQAQSKQKDALAQSQEILTALDARLTEKRASAPHKSDGETAAPPAPPKAGEYNFAELARNSATGNVRTDAENALIREKAVESTQVLVAWIKTAMQRYTKDTPLLVRRPNAPLPSEFKVISDSQQRFVFIKNGAERAARDWQDLEPTEQAELILGVFLDSPSTPPPEVLAGADAFAYLQHLPEMAAALHPAPP